jgi:nitroimidazol reductase NimA-like FMN-containing flavoprotein (pyridoxamine 5'-phosphate oxidase superfamily)
MVEFKGDWDLKKIEEYLNQTRFPLRFSCITSKGYPTVFSLWYIYENDRIWCAVQEDSAIANILRSNNKCGFEVGPNSSPYKGVRGKGDAKLVSEKGGEVLEKLIDRFLDDTNAGLSDWLLSRKDTETAICIDPIWFYSWDYSQRMA